MLRTGIITTYLSLRLLVISGFPNTYPTFRQQSTEDNFWFADHPGVIAGSLVLFLLSAHTWMSTLYIQEM
jgi:hypothetical protein